MITENLSTLKIHKLTQEQYDRELSAGRIDNSALYLTPDTYHEISMADILQNVYPVGAIYLSINDTSPASLFGGTWEQIQDRFLLGASSTRGVGTTGGEATHTLSIAEMPSHLHSISSSLMWANQTGNIQNGTKTYYARSEAQTTQTAGGSKPHNNMPPYLAVYMWKRIA